MGKFNLCDKVTWNSSASGSMVTKTGEIVAVIPAHSHPTDGAENRYGYQNRTIHLVQARDHESYLVRVGKRHRLYWPVVNKLHKVMQ